MGIILADMFLQWDALEFYCTRIASHFGFFRFGAIARYCTVQRMECELGAVDLGNIQYSIAQYCTVST